MKKTIKLFSAIFVFAVTCLFLSNPVVVSAAEEPVIIKGVFIGTVEVSGMTASEAKQALEDHIEGLQKKTFAVVIGDKSIYATMGDLGYTYEPNHYIKQALGLGKSGNLIKRYKDNKDIEQGKIVYPLTYTYDDSKLQKLIEVDARKYDVAPVNASFTRKNGEFLYTDHVFGSKVNVGQTVAAIKNRIENWNRMDFIVKAVMEEVVPEFTKEELQQCTSVLGEFTTEFKDSSEDRAANLANGAKLINNAVLYPGDVFSSYKFLLPFSVSNGYYAAGSYNAGRIEQSIGGGACQVTTTLYNAVLFSELEVVERSAHSMTVSYVDLSMDAAIAEGSKNFQFKNSTELPILIEAFSEDRKITFRIWGHETRDTDNRELRFETVVTSEIKPPAKDKITEDPTKPTSYKKVTQKARNGYKAELYKIVYKDGKEIERTLINKSYYQAEPNHVTVGTMKESQDRD